MARGRLPDLSLTEWAILAVLAEGNTHGFAISKEFAADGDLGQIWTVRRPIVYRTLTQLEGHRLIRPLRSEPGHGGPTRLLLGVTGAGKSAVDRWLLTPSDHVRDLRTQLLLQFRFLDRRGLDLSPLAEAQLEVLTPILASLRHQAAATAGFAGLIAQWRYESTEAAVRVLEGLVRQTTTA
jgi:PadR family transcriptional regulator AphA